MINDSVHFTLQSDLKWTGTLIIRA